jgi:ribosomal protein S18 acetylase RimI-like enzyme
MTPTIEYRRGSVKDLTKLRLAQDLSVTSQSIEFNVIGAGHEFWIAIEDDDIVGLTVLGKTTTTLHTILYLHVSTSHKSKGVGSALIKAVIESYPESEFAVVPFDGTEEFYRQLGFLETKKWEMRRSPVTSRKSEDGP